MPARLRMQQHAIFAFVFFSLSGSLSLSLSLSVCFSLRFSLCLSLSLSLCFRPSSFFFSISLSFNVVVYWPTFMYVDTHCFCMFSLCPLLYDVCIYMRIWRLSFPALWITIRVACKCPSFRGRYLRTTVYLYFRMDMRFYILYGSK